VDDDSVTKLDSALFSKLYNLLDILLMMAFNFAVAFIIFFLGLGFYLNFVPSYFLFDLGLERTTDYYLV
jgi:hypothetical protein